MLIERVVGRRLDPETGDIYHIKFKPPPSEIEDRLVQRFDDTEEKVAPVNQISFRMISMSSGRQSTQYLPQQSRIHPRRLQRRHRGGVPLT